MDNNALDKTSKNNRRLKLRILKRLLLNIKHFVEVGNSHRAKNDSKLLSLIIPKNLIIKNLAEVIEEEVDREYLHRLFDLSLIEILIVETDHFLSVANFHGSINSLKEVLELNPEHNTLFYAYYFLGESYLNIDDTVNAEEYLLEAIKIKPDGIRALLNLGYSFVKNHKYEEAEKYLFKALKIDKKNPIVLTFLAYYYIKLLKFTEAEKILIEANLIKPNQFSISQLLGYTLLKNEKYNDARDVFLKTLNLIKKESLEKPSLLLKVVEKFILTGLGYSYIKMASLKEAIECLGLACSHEPLRADAFNNLAIAYFKIEKWEMAKFYIKIALNLKPENDFIQKNHDLIFGEEAFDPAPILELDISYSILSQAA